jgi:SNF family Na+-dependent transporter
VTDRVQIAALSASIGLLFLVLELIRRRRLSEEYSVLWIVSALALIGISWRRGLLDTAAQWLGVYYPPALLLLAVILIMFTASLTFSVILSRHQRQIDRLIEETAVLSAEVRELRDAKGPATGAAAPGLARSSSAR